MRKIFLIALISLLALFASLLKVKSVYAADYDCLTVSSDMSNWVIPTGNSNEFYFNDEYYRAGGVGNIIKGSFTFSFNTSSVDWNSMASEYRSDLAVIIEHAGGIDERTNNLTITSGKDGPIRVDQTGNNDLNLKDGEHIVQLVGYGDSNHNPDKKKTFCTGSFTIVPKISCQVEVTSDSRLNDIDSIWTINVTGIEMQSSGLTNLIYFLVDSSRIPDSNCGARSYCPSSYDVSGTTFKADIGKIADAGTDKHVEVHIVPELAIGTNPIGPMMCANTFTVYPKDDAICEQSPCKIPGGRDENRNCIDSVCQPCSWCRLHPTPTLTPIPTPTDSPECHICARDNDCSGDCASCGFCHPPTPILTNTPIPPLPDLVKLCDQIDGQYKDACHKCVDPGGMWTAIGCLPTTGLETFLKDYLFTFGMGIAGGIAFLYFLYGVFLFLTSAGNAEVVAQAKEIIVSALSGLLFIIFSIFFLQLIGVQILRIPGFG